MAVDLPTVGGDAGEWGDLLNAALQNLDARPAADDATIAAVAADAGSDTRAALSATYEALGTAASAVAPIAPDGGARAVGKGELMLNAADEGASPAASAATNAAAFQAAIDAAEAAGGGTVYIPAGVYSTNGITIDGGSVRLRGAGPAATVLQCSSGDLLTLGGAAAPSTRLVIDNLRLRSTSGGGHVIAVPYGLAQSRLDMLHLQQDNDAKSLFYCDRPVSGGGIFDVHFTDDYFLHKATATVPGVHIVGAGNACSANKWTRCRVQASGDFFFHIEAKNSGSYAQGNTFDTINFELCDGGGIRLVQALATTIIAPQFHDNGTITKDCIQINRGTTSSVQSRGTLVMGYSRSQGTLSGGAVDINLGAAAANEASYTTIIGITGPSTAGIAVNCFNSERVTILGYDSGNVTITSPSTGHATLVSADQGVTTPRIAHTGTALGFYGTTPIARPTLPAAGVVTAADIRTALLALGLCQ